MINKYLSIWTIMFMVLFSLNSFSQPTGKVSYTVVLESENFKELEATLYFNGLESYFFVDMNLEELESNQDEEFQLIDDSNIHFEFDFTLKRPTRYEVYTNRERKNILSQSSIFENGSTNPCVVLEETGSINWKITGESKKIGSFNTRKATTAFRGRSYTVWFTTEIPVAIGPWKFHGLPGLILEVKDEEMGVQFLFSSIEVPYIIKDEIKQPSDGEIISLSEYVEFDKSFDDEFMKLFKSKLPRDVSISNISIKKVKKSIEREY